MSEPVTQTLHLARSLVLQKKYESCIKIFGDIETKRNLYPDELHYYGRALLELGDTERAISALKGAETCSEPHWALYFLGNALKSSGRAAEALATWHQAMNYARDDLNFVRHLSEKYIGVLAEHAIGDVEKLALSGIVSILDHYGRRLDCQNHLALKIADQTSALEMRLNRSLDEIKRVSFDALATLHGLKNPLPAPFALRASAEVAIDSNDHMFPRGTASDNTRHPRLVARCEELYPDELTALDLGCAGGGLVYDFVSRGHRALGLEGSDFSKRDQRACWRILPDHLKTCDITQEFIISDNGKQATFQFKIICAWEVLEHIPEIKISGLLDNVQRHLAPDGYFIASIAQFEDADPESGITWHLTLRPKDWWLAEFKKLGLVEVDSPFAVDDYVRGSGNPSASDWDVRKAPQHGFHVVVQKK